MGEKRRKILKGKVENQKWKFFFCFSLLKTTEICFESTKMGIFYREKAFHAGEKIRKNDVAPSEKNMPVTPLHTVPFNTEFYGHQDAQSWGLCISLHRLRLGRQQARCVEAWRPTHSNNNEKSGLIKSLVKRRRDTSGCTEKCPH